MSPAGYASSYGTIDGRPRLSRLSQSSVCMGPVVPSPAGPACSSVCQGGGEGNPYRPGLEKGDRQVAESARGWQRPRQATSTSNLHPGSPTGVRVLVRKCLVVGLSILPWLLEGRVVEQSRCGLVARNVAYSWAVRHSPWMILYVPSRRSIQEVPRARQMKVASIERGPKPRPGLRHENGG